ncbi:hypothetical protein LTR62_008561 [Meristemomyces frigidus]|uniref:Uncharacterized protein n=1 Tax=Meristemomyces frigidus TaxID=1508187 RepID=A0AAN7YIW1_9PEZI|nr:hypothetical protein LTR62_008561 [Meristemomyces frigidus]
MPRRRSASKKAYEPLPTLVFDLSMIDYNKLVCNNITAETPETKSDRHELDPFLKIQKPHPHDVVYAAAVPILQMYNSQDLFRKVDPLLIEALSVSPTLFYGIDTTSAVHLLVRAETFIKIQLKLNCDLDSVWTGTKLVVKSGDRWILFEQFLQGLPKPKLGNLTQRALNEQLRLWQIESNTNAPSKAQKRKLGLLDLPVEVRKLIFLFAVGTHIEPQITYTTPYYSNRASEGAISTLKGTMLDNFPWNDWTQLPRTKPVQDGVLHLSKQLRKEALEALWVDTVKVFRRLARSGCYSDTDHNLTDTLQIMPAACHDHLRHITLAFTFEEYALFFGTPWLPKETDYNWEGQYSDGTTLKALKTLPRLHTLELFFPSTISEKYDPWLRSKTWAEVNQIQNDDEEDVMRRARMPCQAVLCDWVLRFAFEHVMHIKNVRLTGFIKAAVKQKWQALFFQTKNRSNIPSILAQLEVEKDAISEPQT